MHITRNGQQWQKKEDKLLQCSQLCHSGELWHIVPVHDSDHHSVDRIFMGLPWELYCQRQSDRVLEQWQTMGRRKGLRTPPSKWVSAQLLYVWVSAQQWSRQCGLSCELWGFLIYLINYITLHGTIFPYQEGNFFGMALSWIYEWTLLLYIPITYGNPRPENNIVSCNWLL